MRWEGEGGGQVGGDGGKQLVFEVIAILSSYVSAPRVNYVRCLYAVQCTVIDVSNSR